MAAEHLGGQPVCSQPLCGPCAATSPPARAPAAPAQAFKATFSNGAELLPSWNGTQPCAELTDPNFGSSTWEGVLCTTQANSAARRVATV